MKKIIATLLSSILVVTLFVGCSDKKEIVKEPQNQEQEVNNEQENNIVDIKNTKLYKNMQNEMSFKILELSEGNVKGEKSLYAKIDIGQGTDEEMVTNFWLDCSKLATYINEKEKDKKYTMLLVTEKRIGGFAVYSAVDELEKELVIDDIKFSSKKYEKIFNKKFGKLFEIEKNVKNMK